MVSSVTLDTLSLAFHVEQTLGFCHEITIAWLMTSVQVLLRRGDLLMIAAMTCT